MSHGGIQGGAGLKSDAKLQQKKRCTEYRYIFPSFR